MIHSTESSASGTGAALCPPGWKYRVWQNAGWHVAWERGPISVHQATRTTFFAMIADDANKCGYSLALWSDKHGPYRSVRSAIRGAARAFQAKLAQFQAVGDAVAEILEEIENGQAKAKARRGGS